MKYVKNVNKEDVLTLLGSGETVYCFSVKLTEVNDLTFYSIRDVKEIIEKTNCIFFMVEEVEEDKNFIYDPIPDPFNLCTESGREYIKSILDSFSQENHINMSEEDRRMLDSIYEREKRRVQERGN